MQSKHGSLPICPQCTLRPCMEQVDDSWGPEYTQYCGPCHNLLNVIEIVQLTRVRDIAIACIGLGDIKGALSALTIQRDNPFLFDRMLY